MSDKKSAIAKSVSSAASSVAAAVKSPMAAAAAQPGSGSRRFVVAISLIVTVIVGVFAAVFIYNYIKVKTIDRASYVVPQTESPVLGTVVTKGNGGGIPDPKNGKRFTFSFWIYIHNMSKNAGQPRHVLHRGDENNYMTGSPSVIMAPDSNKLHIFFDTTTSETKPSDYDNQNRITKIRWLTAKRGITIDYVPLQRWVHVGVVVNETANGGSIASYVDGELVNTVTTGQAFKVKKSTDTNEYEVQPTLTNLALARKGDIFVGGANDNEAGLGFSGLVSVVQFFNYDLNSKDIYNVYAQGPMYLTAADKLANAIGIGNVTNQYGVRNPIYKKPEISA